VIRMPTPAERKLSPNAFWNSIRARSPEQWLARISRTLSSLSIKGTMRCHRVFVSL